MVKLAQICASLIVGLTLSEAALRLTGYSFPTFYKVDEFRGFALQAGMEGWYRKEGESYVRINSDGLRDREHAKEKPPNTLRIAILGDSHAEALQVSQESTFWTVMEDHLQQCPAFAGRKVEVINFGVSGYGTAQQLITLRRHVWEYSPDIVMLAITTNNDISDNSRKLKKTDEIPYFVYSDGKLALDDSFRTSRAFRWRQSRLNQLGAWLRDSSRVIQAFHHAHYALKSALAKRAARKSAPALAPSASPPATSPHPAATALKPAPTSSRTNAAVNAEDVGIDNLVYSAPFDAVCQEVWQITEDLLVLMRDEIESKGARFLVVTLSNGIQVYPESAVRESFMQRVSATNLFYPDLRIKALGECEGITVSNLAPELQAYAERHKVFLHGFGKDLGNGHWNTEGHRVAGELLAQKLCAELANSP